MGAVQKDFLALEEECGVAVGPVCHLHSKGSMSPEGKCLLWNRKDNVLWKAWCKNIDS